MGKVDKPLIIDTAKEIIYGERQSSYGSASSTHQRIANIWSEILCVPVSAEQVALCMVGLKVARLCQDVNHEDSWVDIIGYAGCWDKIRRGE